MVELCIDSSGVTILKIGVDLPHDGFFHWHADGRVTVRAGFSEKDSPFELSM
jgi:hypothetical protein